MSARTDLSGEHQATDVPTATHRYFSIVENHRIASDKTVQRTVLYLGEINDQQQAPGARRCRCLMNSSKSMRT